jgi:hypothetical protein
MLLAVNLWQSLHFMEYAVLQGFYGWAVLDSNQRPWD